MMKKLLILPGLFFLFTIRLLAGDGDYAVSKISAGLLKNANVIKRMEELRFEIAESNKAKYYQKVAYTILNENGERWAYFSEGYDKLRSIEFFEGSLYDFNGKKIKSLKKSDIKDITGSDDGLADDNRIKWHSFYYKGYPYTVEYEVEVHYKGTMFLPIWLPQEKEMMSVQHSAVKVITPATNPVKYKMFNYRGEPVITIDKSNKIYSWEIKDLAATVPEFYSPSWHTITTSVFMAAEKFTLGNYQGSNANWKEFGRFVYDLKKDRDNLPEDIKQKVHQLTEGVKDINEKIRLLYEYMQQNTRFISIQLGVGGWQPFDANYVGTKKYGDCKALSNFMYSLLKEAGIRSVYTVTGRGDDNDYILTDFPSSQFNHVILFVPFGKDTTWLECTSQTLSPGYMGSDNSNRYAVAVDENGGKLVRTPNYDMNENLQARNIKAVLEDNGTLKVAANTRYSGMQQDDIHGRINALSKEKVKEYLEEQLDFSTYDINQFNYKEQKSSLPSICESLDITVSNYATITGKRLFILPNVMTRSGRKLSQDSTRKYDIQLGFEYKDVDSVEIELPKGYETESIPKDVSISSQFGKYSSSVKLKDNKLYYYRVIEHNSGRYPAKEYGELVEFYAAIYKADRSRVVLVKNEQPLKAF